MTNKNDMSAVTSFESNKAMNTTHADSDPVLTKVEENKFSVAFFIAGSSSIAIYNAVLLCSSQLFVGSIFAEMAFFVYSAMLCFGTFVALYFAFDPLRSSMVGTLGMIVALNVLLAGAYVFEISEVSNTKQICLVIAFGSMGVLGFCCALPQSGIYAYTNCMPVTFIGKISLGQGAVGVLLFLFAQSLFSAHVSFVKTPVFVLAEVISVCGVASLLWVSSHPMAVHALNMYRQKNGLSSSCRLEDNLKIPLLPHEEDDQQQFLNQSISSLSTQPSWGDLPFEKEEIAEQENKHNSIPETFKVIWEPTCAMFCVLTGCFTAVPGPLNQLVNPKYRIEIIGLFQLFDLVGRRLADSGIEPSSTFNLHGTILRALTTPFVVVFLDKVNLGKRVLPFVFSAVLGITRGYQGTLATLQVNRMGKSTPVHSANILTSAVVLGTCFGAGLCTVFYQIGIYKMSVGG